MIKYTVCHVIIPFLKLFLWILVNRLFRLIQSVVWKITGLDSKLKSLYSSKLDTSVHIQKIHARFKMHLMMPPYGLGDFIATHEMFMPESYLMKSNITLYAVTFNEAIFIETDEAIDVVHSSTGGFMRVEQYRHAIKVITMPFKNFLEFGLRLGTHKFHLIMIPNTGRCGSTLLNQIMEASDKCVALSEPVALDIIFDCVDKFEPGEVDRVVTSLVYYGVLCKEVDKPVETFVIKTMGMETSIMPYIARSFPQAKFMFMYRNRAPVTRSLFFMCYTTPIRPLLVNQFLFDKFKSSMIVSSSKRLKLPVGLLRGLLPENIIQLLAVPWVFNIHQYSEYRKQGLDMVAIRYEDILEDPEYAICQIMQHCGMGYNKEHITQVLGTDSQRDSPVSKNVLRNVNQDLPMSYVMAEVDKLCEICGFSDMPQDYIVPHTITNRAQMQKQMF